MGGRLLRAWLLRPLLCSRRIRDRLDAVEELAFRTTDRGKLREVFKTVQDLERLMSRVALSTAGPRDLVGLRTSLAPSRACDAARGLPRRPRPQPASASSTT
jgi:DNA mismatch repair protein MutS